MELNRKFSKQKNIYKYVVNTLKSSIFLAIREIQVETTLRFNLIFVKMTRVKKTANNTS